MTRQPTAADCKNLWEAGACDMQELADIYVGLSHRLDATGKDQKHAFERFDAHLSGCPGTDIVVDGVSGPVYPEFVALRDEFQSIMARTADNLRDTGEALRQAAIAYSRTDSDSSNDIAESTTEIDGYKRKRDDEYSDKDPKFP